MKRDFKTDIQVYLFLAIILAYSFASLVQSMKLKQIRLQAQKEYKQPELTYGLYPWTVRSIDTQIISKHWPDVKEESVIEQVGMLKKLGVNYIAVGTPYDRVEDLKLWANAIHDAGLNVWFRSHWIGWEGDEGVPADMTPEEYLEATRRFIIENPDLFAEGDSFTVAVEAEQVGIGLGRKFLSWDEYRKFLLSEISIASEAFEEIGLGGKVHTNWLSMNGWVVENQLTPELVEQIGLIVVDHFVGQSKTIGEINDIDKVVGMTLSDLDSYYTKYRVPILLGEWGYQIFQEVPEEIQAQVIKKLFISLKGKPYLVGVNYWTHMGNSSAIIDDEFGANLRYKESALVIKSFFDEKLELPQ